MTGGAAARLRNLKDSINLKTDEETMTDYKFYGWVGKDKNSIGNLKWEEYEPKKWTEDDVDIKISMFTDKGRG
jgi:hypothetical protein